MDEDGDQAERYEDVIYDDEVEEVIPIGPHDQEEGMLQIAYQYMLSPIPCCLPFPYHSMLTNSNCSFQFVMGVHNI